ncbi:TRAP transporter substrate-binding protein [Yunchengibacter salinarum]|uniref:TRAP transporter substrate-binding protein n=1 Tax=Yunchengibacter salinarum TaxID=3133399 RepID=UPI0035B6179B
MLAACGQGGNGSGEGAEGGGAPSVARGKRTLKMVTAWPKNFPGLGTGAARLAQRITDMTDGRITVRLYAAGELVGALGGFDAVAQGQADMVHAAEYYWQGKHPAFSYFAAVPMGLNANEMNAWIRFGGGQELWDDLSARFNMKAMPAGNSGVQMGGWFNKTIDSVEDFQGLRIRMPGLGGEVMARLGATTVTKQGGEIFQALSQGNIDATEWVGPWNDLAFGFHTIVKNYYYPGIHEPGTTLSLGLNLDLWNDLAPADRALIEAAAAAENDIMLAEFNANNARALDTLINKHGVTLHRFSEPILAELARISRAVLEETATHDDLSKRVHDSFMAARTNGMRWGEVAERAFFDARRATS